MEKFLGNFSKKSSGYLEQVGNNNLEKGRIIIDLLNSDSLPRINGEVRLLEIGIGSGDTINEIKKEIKDPRLVVFGMDLFEAISRRIHNTDTHTFGIVADLNQFPFAERSLSGINLSSVIHEGISYNQKLLQGYLTIDQYIVQTFSRLIHSLEYGGVLVYRDPGLQLARTEIRGITYDVCLGNFINEFLAYFTPIFTKLNWDTPADQRIDFGKSEILASMHFHREFQRHLLTFLDFAYRQERGTSLKEITTSLISESAVFEDVRDFIHLSTNNTDLVDTWLKREGEEMYTYRSLREIELLIPEIEALTESRLTIESRSTIQRNEYTFLLRKLCSEAIEDTKQNLALRKTK